jgi:hypothetical protein
MPDEMIPTTEAAQILQVADCRAARRVLIRHGTPLVRRGRKLLFVERAAVEALVRERGGKVGPGRPRKKSPKVD